MSTTTIVHPVRPGYASSPLGDAALLIGRIALVVIFLMSGVQKFMDIGSVAGMLAAKNLPQPTVLAVLAAVTELGGGLLILLGWYSRLAALALMVFTLASAYLFHDFWNMPAGGEQMNNMIHAMKNLSIAGAFLMLAGSGPGRFSIDGRAAL